MADGRYQRRKVERVNRTSEKHTTIIENPAFHFAAQLNGGLTLALRGHRPAPDSVEYATFWECSRRFTTRARNFKVGHRQIREAAHNEVRHLEYRLQDDGSGFVWEAAGDIAECDCYLRRQEIECECEG
jgi:hypothetical protein